MKIRDILKSRSNWTRFVLARTNTGVLASVFASDACSFCLSGALQRAYPEATAAINAERKLKEAIKHLFPSRPCESISAFNDCSSTTFEDVCRVVDWAGV